MSAAEAMPEPAVKVEDAEQGWHSLGTQADELRLEWTLPTGQSFRWWQTGEGEFTGVVGQRALDDFTRVNTRLCKRTTKHFLSGV